jgi:hypothetical protein
MSNLKTWTCDGYHARKTATVFALRPSLTSRPSLFTPPSVMLQFEAREAEADAGGAEGGYDT